MMRETKERYTPLLLSKPNVVGVGIGKKESQGKIVESRAISVLVTEKVPEYALTAEDLVPATIESIPTDVVEVGLIQAPPPKVPIACETGNPDWQKRMRPARPGASVGHYLITAGTFGCVVEDPGGLMILSNNHVLANSNVSKTGDKILQPGRYDGGTADDVIGILGRWERVRFIKTGATCSLAKWIAGFLNDIATAAGSEHRLEAYRRECETNLVDAAVARPHDPDELDPNILDDVGIPNGVDIAKLGMDVQKCGRTTGHTYGYITQIEATVQVSYGTHGVALFRDQVIAVGEAGSSMSAGGDSGSAVLSMENDVVGLLFAGSKSVTIMNPIDTVLSLLQVELVT